jgi:hypothetical protein
MNAQLRRITAAAGLTAILLGSVSCGKVSRTGRSPAMLVLDLLEAASGASSSQFEGALQSDVITNQDSTDPAGLPIQVPTRFQDVGQAQMRILLKDQGVPGTVASPSALNSVTVNRYHVAYQRTDGRNVPGVDVPHPFDGAVTVTISSAPVAFTFPIVRIQAKLEAPLMALCSSAPGCTDSAAAGLGGAGAISTIANVTFYGQDLAGNAVSVTGSLSITFADWADPL